MKRADTAIAFTLPSGQVQMLHRTKDGMTTISDRTLLQFATVFAKIEQKKRARGESHHAQKAA